MARGLTVKRAESRCIIAAVLSAFSFSAFDAEAQLTGGQVVAGQATISSPSATSTLIHQSSQNAIINWSSFSIPSGSSVAFQQPNASAIALNRVTGGSVSLIYGSLTANGRVWLINPSGIVLGPSAQVSAPGVLLSTIGIRDADFLAGNYDFAIAGDPNAAIVNGGRIVASRGGSVVLAAPRVRNDGLIEADLGTVVLAGAKTVTVDFAGDDLLKFAVPTAAVDTVAAGTDALVKNAGTLAAPGGRVLLTAAAAKGVLDNVINTSGIVEATSVASVNGKIVLSASGGAAQVSGTLDASGKGAGESGGTIDVLGDAVTLASGARLDASGDVGGGTVLAGGNFHGAGPEQNAQVTVVEAGALIDASALTRGDGGRVAVWSDGSTSFAGSILARGGADGGNGGYVETSGHQILTVADGAIVDTRAPKGKNGTWLLDPVEIDITNADSGTSVTSFGSGNGTDSLVTSDNPVGPTSTVSNTTIENGLQNGSVVVQTSIGDIAVDANIVPNNNIPPGSVSASNGSLALLSAANIVLNADIDFASAQGSPSSGSLYLQAGGAITYSSGTITLANGQLSLQAQTGIGTVSQPVVYAGGDIAAGTTSGGIFIQSTGALNVVTVSSAFIANNFIPAPLGIFASAGDVSVDAQSNDIFIGEGSQSSTIAVGSSAGDTTVNGANLLMNGGAPSEGAAGAQIGADVGGANGNITVTMSGGITLNGGSGTGQGAYAQIGHGGPLESPGSTGAIFVTAGSDITLNGGPNTQSYVQIGHGGATSTGTNSGGITVITSGGLRMTGGSGSAAYAQIGDGGADSDTSNLGNILVTAATTVSLHGGSGGEAYAQIGHGGYRSSTDPSGTENGSVTVNVTGGDAVVSAGAGAANSFDYGMIGNGDPVAATPGLMFGDITLNVSGATTLLNTSDSIGFIGNGSSSSGPTGNLILTSGSFVSPIGELEASISAGLAAGVVSVTSTGTGAFTIAQPISYTSNNFFELQAPAGNLVLDGAINSGGAGGMTLVGQTITLGANIATAGGMINTFGPITLTANGSIVTSGSGAGIAIVGSIDAASAGAQSLSLNSGAGSISIVGIVGGTQALGAVTMTGSNIDLTSASIVTKGAPVTFNGKTSFGGVFLIDTTAGGTVSPSTVSFTGTTNDFSLDGQFKVAGSLDFPNGGFSVHGPGDLLIGPGTVISAKGPITVGTSGSPLQIDAQSGGGSLTLDPGGSAATLFATLAGLSTFTVQDASSITLGGSAATTGLQSYTTSGVFSAASGQLTASALTIGGNGITLGASTTVTTSGDVNVNGGSVTLDGAINSGGNLTVTGSAITLGGSIATTGSQTYSAAVTLNANTTLTGAGSNKTIQFTSSIDDLPGLSSGGLTIDPFAVITMEGSVGSQSPLAFLTLTATSQINIAGSVTTTGAQTYSAPQLNLDTASNPSAVYQTNGGTFSETGSTFLGGSPDGGSPASITIDTTGGGASPGGAGISFTSPGAIDGDVALSFVAGTGGAIVVGAFGGSLVSIDVVSGASFKLLTPPAPSGFICPATICIPPEVVDVTDPNVEQQLLPHIPLLTLLLDFELPPATLGFSPPLPIFLTGSGPSSGPDNSGGGDGTMLTSVVDLDTGSQLFSQISPNSGGTSEQDPDPLTILTPITPAPQPVPPPQTADEPVGGTGGTLFHARDITPSLPGVPGVDQPSLGAGNRGLWFASPNASP